MICDPCREAGRRVSMFRNVTADEREAAILTEFGWSEVRRLREQCPGGTWCCCQHALNGVNWIMIREAERAPRAVVE